jgi:hypothetical protein
MQERDIVHRDVGERIKFIIGESGNADVFPTETKGGHGGQDRQYSGAEVFEVIHMVAPSGKGERNRQRKYSGA